MRYLWPAEAQAELQRGSVKGPAGAVGIAGAGTNAGVGLGAGAGAVAVSSCICCGGGGGAAAAAGLGAGAGEEKAAGIATAGAGGAGFLATLKLVRGEGEGEGAGTGAPAAKRSNFLARVLALGEVSGGGGGASACARRSNLAARSFALIASLLTMNETANFSTPENAFCVSRYRLTGAQEKEADSAEVRERPRRRADSRTVSNLREFASSVPPVE